jgi:hypothetical protein
MMGATPPLIGHRNMTRRDFRLLFPILLTCVAISTALRAQQPLTSREVAIAVEQVLRDHPGVYPRELVEKCTALAITEVEACRPDPAVVKKLAALGDNAWLEMNDPESKGTPANHHSFPRNRGEGSATYDAATKAVVCFAGCGAPEYSSDLWVYKTAANRWFEVWPNVPRSLWKKLENEPRDRPPAGCTLGLTYADETGCLYRFTCANTGDDSSNVWETKLLSGAWRIVGRETAAVPTGGIRVVADPVLGGLLAVSPVGTRVFSFRTKEWTTVPGDGPRGMHFCCALTYLAAEQCALFVGAPGNRPGGAPENPLPEVETWLFHSRAMRWEKVASSKRPEWYYRAGITYDSRNQVAIFGGWKSADAGSGPDVSPGLWIFDPAKKDWHFENPSHGPKGRYEYFAYDPENNVVVTAGNGHGTWVYRYKGGPPK